MDVDEVSADKSFVTIVTKKATLPETALNPIEDKITRRKMVPNASIVELKDICREIVPNRERKAVANI